MTYNVVLVSGIQQSDSYISVLVFFFFPRFFSLISYYKILGMVLHGILGSLDFILKAAESSMILEENIMSKTMFRVMDKQIKKHFHLTV